MSWSRQYVTELVWGLVLLVLLCCLPADSRASDEKETLDSAGGCQDDWDDCGYE